MPSESNQRASPNTSLGDLPPRSRHEYALGYCSICGDRDPEQVSLAPIAKRLVCASCFKEFGAPSTCTLCGRQVYAGDWVTPGSPEELLPADDPHSSSEDGSSSQSQGFFFCDPCLEHRWPACNQQLDRLQTGDESPSQARQMTTTLQLLHDAVLGDFRCPGCNALIEPDFEKCGGCGTTNPLRQQGLI